MPTPEHAPHVGPEKLKHIEYAPEVLDKAEHAPEESREEVEKSIESAREQAEHEAILGREAGKESQTPDEGAQTHRPHLSRKESYKHTMRHVRSELSAPERVFSKLIHSPAIERTSDAVGKTVARPNAILSGSIFACAFVLGLYILARFYGFELRGSETILAFLLGWAVGIIFDILRGVFKRNRS